MSNSRTFGLASGNHITTDLGDIPTNLVSNDFTAIVVFRRGTSGNGRGILLCGTNTSDEECFGLWVSSSDRLYTNVGDGWDFASEAIASATEEWYLGALTKGSAARVHLGNLETKAWGHGNPGTSIDPTTLKDIRIGNRTPFPASFDGDIAFAAIFEEEFTDQQIENLAAGVFASLNAGATAAWLLDQDDVGDPVLDLVGDADQSSISGTAVSEETPEADGFIYDLIGPPAGFYGRYRASSLSANPAVWEDEGSGENDLLQATSGKQPTFIADGFNGHPCLEFDGDNDSMATLEYSSALSMPNTLVFIGEFVTISGDPEQVFDGLDSGGRHALLLHNGNWRFFAGGSTVNAGSEPSAETPLVSITRWTSNQGHNEVNGDNVGSPSGIGTNPLDGLWVGSRFSDDQSFAHFKVAEIIVYDRELDAGERSQVVAYSEAAYAEVTAFPTDGLVVHLDADAITGLSDDDPVAQWDDLSGEDNHVAQATGALQPLYKTNVLNGKPSVRFDGSDDRLLATLASTITTARTAFAIVKNPINDSEVRPWLSGGVNDGVFMSKWSTDDRWIFGDSSGGGAFIEFTDDAPLGEVGIWSLVLIPSGTSFVRLNGVQEQSGSVSITNLSTLAIGWKSSSRFFLGDIHEILIYDRELTTQEIEDTEAYLTDKWIEDEEPGPGGTHYERSAGTLQFGLSLETPSRSTGFGRSAEPLQFALALEEPSRIASHQRSASPMQFELAFGSVHHGDIMFEPELEGDGSISDQIMASLIAQGFDTGSLLDRERARLLAKLSFTPVGLSNSGITYSTADLYRLAEETPRLIC